MNLREGYVHHNAGKTGAASHRSKKVGQYMLTGKLVKEYVSATEAAKLTGITVASISACCLGRNKTSFGYVWRYL